MEKEIEVTLHGVSADGRSVGKSRTGMTIFVRGGIPGQIVLVRIEKEKKNMAEGVLVSVLQHCKEERDYICPHADVCGGCPWQIIPYSLQIRYKRQIVIDCLRRIGKLEIQDNLVTSVLSTGDEWNYRNKMEFAFGKNEKGLLLGLRERSSHTVFNTTDCCLQNNITMELLEAIRKECEKEGLMPAIETAGARIFARKKEYVPKEKGQRRAEILKYAVIRQPKSGGCFAELITEQRPELYGSIRKIGENLLSEYPNLSGFIHSIQTKNIAAAYGDKTITRLGATEFSEKLQIGGRDIEFKLGHDSFFQVNTEAAELLYNTAVKLSLKYFIQDKEKVSGKTEKIGKTCWDIYCGVGGLALSFAPYFDFVFGMEAVQSAIESARINAHNYSEESKRNNLPYPIFSFKADTAGHLLNYFRKYGVPDLVIADPPRSGLDDKMTDALLEYQPKRITMISCNPATLARDLGRLSDKYEILSICPVDLFPQTQHIEVIGILSLKS